MSLGGYLYTFGMLILGAVGMGVGTFVIIRLDEPKRGKNKVTDA